MHRGTYISRRLVLSIKRCTNSACSFKRTKIRYRSAFYHFFEKYTKKYNKPIEIYSDALHLLENYNWPGNIRELENVTERLVVINQNNIIDKKTVALVLGIRDTDSYAHPEDEYNLKASTIALEKHIIEKALATFHTKRKAATALGIDHSTLVKKCQRYGI